jgi:hypothetical protein
VYSISETRKNISEIQKRVSKGLISKIENRSTKEDIFMVSAKMFEASLGLIDSKNNIELDEELNIYTCYNKLIPQFYGEGDSKATACENMFDEAVEFLEDYEDNIDLYANIFNGVQQFFLSHLLFNIEDTSKIKEMLNIG